MRIKSHWFREGAPKSAEDIASAAAFIIWRVAQNALKTMRAANYELAAGPRYFAFLSEFLVFLTLGADRIAHARGDDAWRVAFTTATANRVGAILAENESDLLGTATASDIKGRFVAQVNGCSVECAACGWSAAGPAYDFLRCFGHRVADVLDERDRTWAISQVIEVEGPNAADLLRRGMDGLLGVTPRPSRRRAGGAAGE